MCYVGPRRGRERRRKEVMEQREHEVGRIVCVGTETTKNAGEVGVAE